MQDIREIVQMTLDKAFSRRVKVVAEELVTDNMPDEYISYSAISGVYTAYANDKPIQRLENVDVDWYGKKLSQKSTRMEEIEAAMRAAGFCVESLPNDLGRDAIGQRYGATMEFSLYRTVPRDGN